MKAVVKICGLANERDVKETASAMPDAMGFIFWPKSPRAVSGALVAEWTRGDVDASIQKVGVFVDSSVADIQKTADVAGLDIIQLHGPYTADQIKQIERPVWRVLHTDRLPEDWNDIPVSALLVDSGTVSMPGGTGIQVNTASAISMRDQSNFPLLLAGGLNADNVGSMIEIVSPDGVDVSSGVESVPGTKDMNAVRSFIRNARAAFSS